MREHRVQFCAYLGHQTYAKTLETETKGYYHPRKHRRAKGRDYK